MTHSQQKYHLIPLLFFCIMGGFSAEKAQAIPQFSLLSGNRCVNCHANSQGGALRSNDGWYSYADVSLLSPRSVGLEGLYETDKKTNTFFNDVLTLGFDARGQMLRSHKSPDAERRFIPMQLSLYAAVSPFEWMTLDGAYNAGPKKYEGQQSWSASALIQPSFTLPSLRIGYFQPTIGIRYDDHTILTRQYATAEGTKSLIAPNFAEYGAEITYEGLLWLTASAGIFNAKSLAENNVSVAGGTASLIKDDSKPSVAGRLMFWPRAFEHALNMYAGASALVNGDFSYTTVFGGAGLTDRLSLWAEYARSEKTDIQKTNAISAELAYQPTGSVIVSIRGEQGTTSDAKGLEVTTKQAVFGVQALVLPYLELRPEFRWMDTETYTSTRYAFQIHIFY